MPNATSGLVLSSAGIFSTRVAATAQIENRELSELRSAPYFSTQNGLSGVFRVAGTTIDGGVAAKRTVYLFSQPSMTLVRAATTELPIGAFSFTGLAAGKYLVVGVDPQGLQNAVAYSEIVAVP